MRRQMQRRLTVVAQRRADQPRPFIRSLHIVRPDIDGAMQTAWLDLAEECVLADIGREQGQRLLLTVYAESERRVRVDAGGWRYLVGIGEGNEPAAAILAREPLRW